MVKKTHFTMKELIDVLEPGFVLYYTPYFEEAVESAINYCKFNNLTPNDARIIKERVEGNDDEDTWDAVVVYTK